VKLSESDHGNITVFEVHSPDEQTLLAILARYFLYRSKLGYSPDDAKYATLRWRTQEREQEAEIASRRSQGARDGWDIRRAKMEPAP